MISPIRPWNDWEDAHGTHAHVAQVRMLQILREPYAIMRFQSMLLGLFEIFCLTFYHDIHPSSASSANQRSEKCTRIWKWSYPSHPWGWYIHLRLLDFLWLLKVNIPFVPWMGIYPIRSYFGILGGNLPAFFSAYHVEAIHHDQAAHPELNTCWKVHFRSEKTLPWN